MDNLLSGLDKLGLNLNDFNNLYEDVEEPKKEVVKEEAVKTPVFNEAEVIFEKTISCPICGKEFKTKVVRTGKAKLVSTDTDLKPVYAGFEPLKYDIIACLHCGYAATSKSFGHITPGQVKMIRESISQNFRGMTNSSGIYTFQEAIERHKLALANVMVMHGKSSERAYICLKMAWLYRSMLSGLPENDVKLQKLREECMEGEKSCLKSAYEGFTFSYTKEVPPICGMDINTLTYLLADLARRCGDFESCKKYIAAIFNSRNVNSRLKERARELKELLEHEKSGN